MIDKSKAEMAAIRESGVTFLLCYFHVLQDWERFLRSSSSGVRSAEDRHGVILSIARLKQQRDQALFDKEVSICSFGKCRDALLAASGGLRAVVHGLTANPGCLPACCRQKHL